MKEPYPYPPGAPCMKVIPPSPPTLKIEQPIPVRNRYIPFAVLEHAIQRRQRQSQSAAPERPSPASALDMATIPTMSYTQATTYLFNCLQLCNLSTKQTIPIDLQICDVDDNVVKERVQFKCALTGGSDLMTLVMMIQLEVDLVGDKIYGNLNKGPEETDLQTKLLMKSFQVIIGDAMAGMPLIAGELIGESEGGKVVRFVKWACNGGEVEQYWDRYREYLLKVAGTGAAPLFKILTARCDSLPNSGFASGGHHFNRLAQHPPQPRRGVQFPFKPLEAAAQAARMGQAAQAARLAQEARSGPQVPFMPRQTQGEPFTPRKSSTPAEASSSKTPATHRVRTLYTKAEMEAILREFPDLPKIPNQPDVEPAEFILTQLIAKYIMQNNGEQPSGDELHEMRLDIKANGFGSGPELTMMSYELKNGEKPKGWDYYQKLGGNEQAHALFNLAHAPAQTSVTAQFLGSDNPAYEDPIEKAIRGMIEERNARQMPGGDAKKSSLFEILVRDGMNGDRGSLVALGIPKSMIDQREAARRFDDSDDQMYLKNEVSGEGEAVGDAKKSAPTTETKPVGRPSLPDILNIKKYGQPSAPTNSLHGVHRNTPSPHLGYIAGGNQYQSGSYSGHAMGPALQQTPTPSRGGLPQFGAGYSTPGHHTPFNPTAASWNAGGPSHADFTNNVGFAGVVGVNTNRYNYGPIGKPTSAFSPVVPNFQSQAISNQANALPSQYSQGNNSFASSGNNRTGITSLTDVSSNNPFAHKYPVRYEGPPGSVPTNPNRPNFGRPKQSTPLKEFTTSAEVEPDSDAQYGTSMRLHNAKPSLSAILHGESSGSGAAMGGFNVAVGQGTGTAGTQAQPQAFGPGSAHPTSRKDRAQHRPKHSRGGSLGLGGGPTQ